MTLVEIVSAVPVLLVEVMMMNDILYKYDETVTGTFFIKDIWIVEYRMPYFISDMSHRYHLFDVDTDINKGSYKVPGQEGFDAILTYSEETETYSYFSSSNLFCLATYCFLFCPGLRRMFGETTSTRT